MRFMFLEMAVLLVRFNVYFLNSYSAIAAHIVFFFLLKQFLYRVVLLADAEEKGQKFVIGYTVGANHSTAPYVISLLTACCTNKPYYTVHIRCALRHNTLSLKLTMI